MSILRERLSAPAARELRFIRPPVAADRSWPSATDRLTFRRGTAPTGPDDWSAEGIDAFIGDVLRSYGHMDHELSGITLTMDVTPVDATVREQLVPLAIKVQRAKGGGFSARSNVTLAFGYGGTIGQAVHDCLDDLIYRTRLLEDNRAHLGPGPTRELREIDEWRDATSTTVAFGKIETMLRAYPETWYTEQRECREEGEQDGANRAVGGE